MHELCANGNRYSRFAGTRTEWDFGMNDYINKVECPSQLLENWCYEANVLVKLSQHFQTGDSLPLDICDRIAAARRCGVGLSTLRQVFFAKFDIAVHLNADLESTWKRLRDEVALVPMTPNTFPYSTFGHLMGGYDAGLSTITKGYYGYLWSQVYSADMFLTKFKQDGQILKGDAGLFYRQKVLAPGGSVDGMDLLKSFLGREPNAEAFLKTLQ